ncbi:MAG: ArnT family glycosyltransferase [Chthoniobacterales bacterium]
MQIKKLADSGTALLKTRGFRIVFWLLIALLLLASNLPWHLDDYDQAKQAYVSYEIVNGGNWWFQHTPKMESATKPPFLGWVSASLYYAFGNWELAWRLPGFVAAILLLFLIWREGERILPEFGGILCVAACYINFLTPRIATLVRTDMLLATSIAFCGWMIFTHVRTKRPWSIRWKWAFCLGMTISLLTKGPIIYAFLLPGMAAFFFLVKQKDARRFVWSGWWTWSLPLLIFLAWAAFGLLLNASFYQDVVVDEFLSRFKDGSTGDTRGQPVYYYLPHIIHKLLPWSLLLLGLPIFFKDLRKKLFQQPELLWLMCWTLGSILLMSLIPSKRVDRIFPIVIPASLLMTAMFAELWPLLKIRALAAGTILAAMLLWGGYFTGLVAIHYKQDALRVKKLALAVQEQLRLHDLKNLAVMESNDEGLAMYLGKPQFYNTTGTIRGMVDGPFDSVLLPERRLPRMEKSLGKLDVIWSSPPIEKNEKGRYLLIKWEQNYER